MVPGERTKPFQTSLFFFPLGLLVERITHLANIWAAEEHKCFVLSPNGTCFSEAASGTPCTEAACLHEHDGGHNVLQGTAPSLLCGLMRLDTLFYKREN